MSKDYTPAYNTLKNDLEVIKKHLDNILNPTHLEKLRSIKEKIESFDFPELSQKQETYSNLKELDDTLIAQRPVLKKLIQSVFTPGKLSKTATSLMLIDRFIGRFEGNLSAFLIDLRLDFPEIQEQVDLQDSLGKTLLMYAV